MNQLIILTLFAFLTGGTVFAGATQQKTGTEPGFWDGIIIIYAVVEEYKFETVGINNTLYKFRTLATLTGTLDPVKEKTIEARGSCDGLAGPIRQPPEPGTRIIVLFRNESGQYILPGEILRFMPGYGAIIPIKGDPTEMIQKVLGIVRDIKNKK